MNLGASRSVFMAALLVVLLFVLAFQLGAFEYYIKGLVQKDSPTWLDPHVERRVQKLALRKSTEWDNKWFGITIQQYPNDLMIYQELIYQLKPDLIVEAGTFHGGNAIYMATLLDVVNPKGKIITIDIDPQEWQATVAKLDLPGKDRLLQRIAFIEGSSTSPAVFEKVSKLATKDATVMVLLDSLHTKDHVLAEMKLYAPLVTRNSYLIVNDTQWGEPLEAIREFGAEAHGFEVDRKIDHYMVSCAHEGFLKRVKDAPAP